LIDPGAVEFFRAVLRWDVNFFSKEGKDLAETLIRHVNFKGRHYNICCYLDKERLRYMINEFGLSLLTDPAMSAQEFDKSLSVEDLQNARQIRPAQRSNKSSFVWKKNKDALVEVSLKRGAKAITGTVTIVGLGDGCFYVLTCGHGPMRKKIVVVSKIFAHDGLTLRGRVLRSTCRPKNEAEDFALIKVEVGPAVKLDRIKWVDLSAEPNIDVTTGTDMTYCIPAQKIRKFVYGVLEKHDRPFLARRYLDAMGFVYIDGMPKGSCFYIGRHKGKHLVVSAGHLVKRRRNVLIEMKLAGCRRIFYEAKVLKTKARGIEKPGQQLDDITLIEILPQEDINLLYDIEYFLFDRLEPLIEPLTDSKVYACQFDYLTLASSVLPFDIRSVIFERSITGYFGGKPFRYGMSGSPVVAKDGGIVGMAIAQHRITKEPLIIPAYKILEFIADYLEPQLPAKASSSGKLEQQRVIAPFEQIKDDAKRVFRSIDSVDSQHVPLVPAKALALIDKAA